MENKAESGELSRYLIFSEKVDKDKSILYLCRRSKVKNEDHPAKSGDLIFEGQYLGPSIQERYGDYDYEYDYIIKQDKIDLLLANLLKLCFENGVFDSSFDLKTWLKQVNIPFETWSWK